MKVVPESETSEVATTTENNALDEQVSKDSEDNRQIENAEEMFADELVLSLEDEADDHNKEIDVRDKIEVGLSHANDSLEGNVVQDTDPIAIVALQDKEASDVALKEDSQGDETQTKSLPDAIDKSSSRVTLNVDSEEVDERQTERLLDTIDNSSSVLLNVDSEQVDGTQTEDLLDGINKISSISVNVESEQVDATQTEDLLDAVDKSSSVSVNVDSEQVIATQTDAIDSQEVDATQNKDLMEEECVAITQDKNVLVSDETVNAESILPDSRKPNGESVDADSDEQYIITNNSEIISCSCMQCSAINVAKYACTFKENSSYICSDNCLEKLKEQKVGKVTVGALRVKMFASEDFSAAAVLPTDQIIPAQSVDINDFTQRCKECNKSVDSSSYFSWNTHTYCNDTCLAIFQKITGVRCIQCNTDVPENLIGKYSLRFGKEMKQFCKNSCLLEHKKGQKFCSLCQTQIENEYHGFCSANCFDVHNSVKTPKVGSCAVCLKEKPLEIEFEDDAKVNAFCGVTCFVAYKFVNNVQPLQCEFCKIYKPNQNLTCSFSFGGKTHYLCSKDCQKLFIITNRAIVHCIWCYVKKYNFDMIHVLSDTTQFVVCSLNCYNLYKVSSQALNSPFGCDYCHKDVKPLFHLTTLDAKVHNFCSAYCLNLYKEKCSDQTQNNTTATQMNGTEPKQQVKKIVIVKPRPIPKQRNISTMCKPHQVTKSINCKPKDVQKGCQTDEYSNKIFLPVPVPIYVPAPLHMYAQPVPMPLPFPLPIPIPIFVPTTRKSASGIMKEINKIKNKVPTDPLQAELLMMAEMVAEDKKDDTDSESDDGTAANVKLEPEDTNKTLVEDVLQMATDFEVPVALDDVSNPSQEGSAQGTNNIVRTRRRGVRRRGRAKKQQQQQQQPELFSPVPPKQPGDLEKPDANMCLKYTFGVNAWKQWITMKNLELQKTSKQLKLLKTEMLQLTADELNFSLSLFVKEVRKPNGSEYAPDTIYYLCLGIQQYLYENGRIDNIFCDTFYEKFTDCLNEVCSKFALLYNDSHYIVTRVEEKHLWESKQLGAHSPLVLLNTLMFFNTKHFNLTTVDEHLQLSFSHIMKHWKRNPNQPGAKSVLLRFYPPQTSDGPCKRRVYEQQVNEDNPLRCSVKLYEFYLSKCPESVKTRNDVFYLQPERSCVSDSPVWYSTIGLDKELLGKMLNRVKMVKEINVAILTT